MAVKAAYTIRSNTGPAKLTSYEARAEPLMLDALDVWAGEIQEHARAGHPKVSPAIVRLASQALSQAEVLDQFRERTGLASGEFSGKLRWLTHTGVTQTSIQRRRARVEGSGFKRQLTASVFSAQQHSEDLEFGTATRRAFPFMRPALIAKEKRGQHLLRYAMTKAGERL